MTQLTVTGDSISFHVGLRDRPFRAGVMVGVRSSVERGTGKMTNRFQRLLRARYQATDPKGSYGYWLASIICFHGSRDQIEITIDHPSARLPSRALLQ
jgi:hypothetical protein